MSTITPLHLAIAFVVGGIVGVLTMHALTPKCPDIPSALQRLEDVAWERGLTIDSLRNANAELLARIDTVQDHPDTVRVEVRRWVERLRPFEVDSSAKYLIADPQ